MYDPRIVMEPTIHIQEPWMWAGMIVVMIAAFIVTRRRPDWGLATIIAALPLYQVRGDMFGLPTTFLELLFGAVILGILSRWLVKGAPGPKEKVVTSSYDRWIGLLLAGSLLAALFSSDIKEGLGLWRAFILEPVIFFYAVTAVFKKRDPKPLLVGVIGALGVLTIWTLYLLGVDRAISYDDRLLGPYQTANYFSLLLVPLITMILVWPRRELVIIRVLAAVTGLSILFFTNSRGGFMALGAAILVALPFLGRRLRMIAISVLVIGGVAAAALFGPKLINHHEDQVVSSRPPIWREAGNVIKADPIFGVGPGQFQDEFGRRVANNHDETLYIAPQAHNAHNVWLVAWTEWGFLTVVSLIAIIITMILTIKRRFSYWMILPSTVLIAILVHGMVDTAIFKNDLAMVFWLVVAMTLILPKAKEKRVVT
ncbi:hypothetical protein EXS54_01615 [Patescibacteria group bacterium]|nr:hypothetical protein [Patescibacteria group bacterium]